MTGLPKLDLASLFPLVLSDNRSLIGLLWLALLRWKLPPAFSPGAGRNLMDWLQLEVAYPTASFY